MNKSIYTKIRAVQKAVGAIEKTSDNPFFHSKYFDINQLLAQLQPILFEQGLTVIQPLTYIEGKPGLLTIVADDEAEMQFATVLPENPDPQKMGSIVTYFRRYALQSLFCLQAEDDDANKASQPKSEVFTAKPSVYDGRVAPVTQRPTYPPTNSNGRT